MLVLIRGAGDLASGIALRLFHAGLSVVMTEIARPTTIRRTVAFSQAVAQGKTQVEDVTARLCQVEDVAGVLAAGEIPVLVDPEAAAISVLKPQVVVDAILAKKNLGTAITDAPVVIGVGPGFTAGVAPLLSASGASRRRVSPAASPTSTLTRLTCAPSSRRERSSSFSVVRCSRSVSSAMSETNSRTVSMSMFSVPVMESASSRMAASGVFSSCEASETKRRRCSSVFCSVSVMELKSAYSSLSSSEPSTVTRWA